MKRRFGLSPVLIELIVVTLFLALSCATLIQLIAKARELSATATYTSDALLLAEDLLERTKADPAGDGGFDESGVRRIQQTQGELTLDGVVERVNTAGGALYQITVRARRDSRELLRLTTSAYVSGGEVGS